MINSDIVFYLPRIYLDKDGDKKVVKLKDGTATISYLGRFPFGFDFPIAQGSSPSRTSININIGLRKLEVHFRSETIYIIPHQF